MKQWWHYDTPFYLCKLFGVDLTLSGIVMWHVWLIFIIEPHAVLTHVTINCNMCNTVLTLTFTWPISDPHSVDYNTAGRAQCINCSFTIFTNFFEKKITEILCYWTSCLIFSQESRLKCEKNLKFTYLLWTRHFCSKYFVVCGWRM